MDVAALIVSILAAGVAAVAAFFTRRSSLAARRSADAAERVDHRAGTPTLSVSIDYSVRPDDWSVAYVVRNAGPVDLDQVEIEVAEGEDGDASTVAASPAGGPMDLGGPIARLGPMRVAESKMLHLLSGTTGTVTHARAVVTAGDATWRLPLELPPSPGPLMIR